MSCVLIVEDETITRSILARVAGTIQGVSALAVGSIQEARAALEVAKPDIAIVDLHLQDGLGFEVLKALDEKGGVATAIIISAHLDEHERALSAAPGRLRCMAKPIDYGELKRTLTSVLEGGARFHGPLAPVEYVQIAGAGRHSVRLSCYDPAGALVGHIAFREGRVWSAETRRLSGLPALRALITESDTRVRLEPASQSPGPPNVDRDWQVAILDALAPTLELSDELSGAAREIEPFVAASHPTSATPRWRDNPAEPSGLPPATSAADLSQLAVRAIVAGDYPRAVLALERAVTLEPDNSTLREQLERLYQFQSSVKQ